MAVSLKIEGPMIGGNGRWGVLTVWYFWLRGTLSRDKTNVCKKKKKQEKRQKNTICLVKKAPRVTTKREKEKRKVQRS